MIKAFRLKPFVVIVAFLLASCGSAATPAATQAPTSVPAPTAEPVTEVPTAMPTAIANTPSIGDQLAEIDDILKQSISASIAYNKPQSMLLDQTTTIELLLNPSLSPEALSTQVTASGEVTSASVQITPRMKAYLIADDGTAFTIQPVHDNPEQLVSGTETTRLGLVGDCAQKRFAGADAGPGSAGAVSRSGLLARDRIVSSRYRSTGDHLTAHPIPRLEMDHRYS